MYTQLKGKAAIDVICNPLGKSGGALIQQFMIVAFGSLAASTPYLGVILLGIVILWLRSAQSLDKQFTGAISCTLMHSRGIAPCCRESHRRGGHLHCDIC